MTKPAFAFALSIACALPNLAGPWSAPVDVLHELKPCVTYRGRFDAGYLVIEAVLQPGWHTFTVDNEERAAQKRAGKPSLGIDQPTQITAGSGLQFAGPWYQLPPKDFSKPALRWYSWGFENQALFVAKVQRAGKGPVQVQIRGQACTDTKCKNVDVSLSVPPGEPGKATPEINLKTLVQALN